MNEYRQKLTELAALFADFPPDARKEFMDKLAESDDPLTSEWLSILQKFDFLEQDR